MWVYSTLINAEHGIRIFKYAPGRSGDNVKEFLKGFKGYLHTDEFIDYGKVKDIITVYAGPTSEDILQMSFQKT